ncbi:MAG: N-acetylmuramoyl-L-alanine amidase [Lentisphaeria bacterium]|nr:MAG: N-acetylmuramoyl-L-alanine amidase [Lentisphaeria bacterium]
MLTLAECPAVLIEAGFISTPAEEEAIASAARQRKAAAAIADGVAVYDAWVRRNALR